MNPTFFDYLPAARGAGLSDDHVHLLYSAILRDYRGDQMLTELRMLRTCLAIQSGHATYEQALQDNAA